MHVESGEKAAVLPDDQELGFDVRWSWDNRWAVYVSPVEGQIGLIDLTDGSRRYYDSRTGEAAVWHPNLDQFLFTQMTELDDAYMTHLFLADVEGQVIDLSGAEYAVDDRNPAWSPDGEWIALRRKVREGAGATRGSQLWLMRADGSDAVALTADPEADHGSPQWSPDGRYLIYHKLPLRGADLEPSIWLLDVETGLPQLVARPGRQPFWVAESRGK